MAGNTRSHKWQITISDPAGKGLTHDRLKEILSGMEPMVYWCMADEISSTGTYHTHLYLQARDCIGFSAIRKRFGFSHIDMAEGTAFRNRNYVMKLGKWEKDKNHETQVPGTIEEWGVVPVECLRASKKPPRIVPSASGRSDARRGAPVSGKRLSPCQLLLAQKNSLR